MNRVLPRGVRAMSMAVTAAIGLSWGALASPLVHADDDPQVISEGHAEVLHIDYSGGKLTAKSRIDTHRSVVDPSSVIFQLVDNADSKTKVPASDQYSFLGKPGDTVWIAPQSHKGSLIFAGYDAEEIRRGALKGDTVDITLKGVEGPGRVEVFNSGSNVRRVWSSTDEAFKSLKYRIGGHSHANWAFSALGRYKMTYEVTATSASGEALSTGPVDFTWHVGDIEGENGQVIKSTTTTLTSNARNADSTMLKAAVSPANVAGTVAFTVGDKEIAKAEVKAGAAETTLSGLPAGRHEVTAKFTPRDTANHAASVSAPVTLEIAGGAQDRPQNKPQTPPAPQAPLLAAPAGEAECISRIVDDGHADYAVRMVDGKLSTGVKVGTSSDAKWHTVENTLLHVKPSAAIEAPVVGLLGSGNHWYIPEIQEPDNLWLGVGSEEIKEKGKITWSLKSFTGPKDAHIALWRASIGGVERVFSTKDGKPNSFDLIAGSHAHTSWGFSAEGRYAVTFTHSFQGKTATSTLLFAVGKTPLPKTQDCGDKPGAPGTGSSGNNASGNLPHTGADVMFAVSTGAAVLVIGAGMVWYARRRRA